MRRQVGAGEDRLATLHRLNVDDLAAAFKLDRLPAVRPLLAWAARPASHRFAREVLHLDDRVGSSGLAAAARPLLGGFTRSLHVSGAEHVPASGPLLVVANHPGVVDVLALWVALERRPDLHVLALEREFLRALPHVRRRLLFVPDDTAGRICVLRRAAAHLREGRALLTFPAGTIEPDPAHRQDAARSLSGWSTSPALLLRLVPDARILPVAVGGVLALSALAHPAARLFRALADRERAAAALQVVSPRLRDTHTRVAFGEALAAADLLTSGTPAGTHARIAEVMQPLLRRTEPPGRQ